MKKTAGGRSLISIENIAGVYLFSHIGQGLFVPVGDNDVRPKLKLGQVPDQGEAPKEVLGQGRLVNDHRDSPLGNPLHHPVSMTAERKLSEPLGTVCFSGLCINEKTPQPG